MPAHLLGNGTVVFLCVASRPEILFTRNSRLALSSSVTFLSSLGIFYGFGWNLAESKLFANYEVRNNAVRIIFAVLFALSCEVFELIIFEILDFLDRE